MDQIVRFFEHPFFSVVGALTSLFAIVGALYAVACFVFGISPIVVRFGMALRNRSIAVFATAEMYASLKSTISASRIFNEKKISHILRDNVDAGAAHSVFLVDWESFGDKIEEVFRMRRGDQVPVIVFAKPGSLKPDQMNDISNRANTVVVNARGRLMNDLVTSLVTTSYDRK